MEHSIGTYAICSPGEAGWSCLGQMFPSAFKKLAGQPVPKSGVEWNQIQLATSHKLCSSGVIIRACPVKYFY